MEFVVGDLEENGEAVDDLAGADLLGVVPVEKTKQSLSESLNIVLIIHRGSCV